MTSAVIFDLSRTLDLVLLPNGSAMLLRNERPAFKLSDAEVKNLERALEPAPLTGRAAASSQTRRRVGRCGDCCAEAWGEPGRPATIVHRDDCPAIVEGRQAELK